LEGFSMLRRWAALAAGLAGLLAAGPAPASDLEFFTGQDLYAACSAKSAEAEGATRLAWCGGYVLGVSDAQQAAQAAGGSNRVCLPGGASAAKMAEAVRVFLGTHPEKRPLAAKDLVIEALAAAYPCA
jgi:hypothetical protein